MNYDRAMIIAINKDIDAQTMRGTRVVIAVTESGEEFRTIRVRERKFQLQARRVSGEWVNVKDVNVF